jgi:hypothetical protein
LRGDSPIIRMDSPAARPGKWTPSVSRFPIDEDSTAMLHFSCDTCGKDLATDSRNRFVVKVEAFAVNDPTELTDEDLEADQIESMAELLEEHEENEDDIPSPIPTSRKMRFDLCKFCYCKFMADPLGRENVAKFDFSEN